MRQAVREHLEQKHAMYGDWNQAERPDTTLMAALGHPRASVYRKLRAFFDRLKFAANASARFYSYIDAGEHSEYWKPDLSVAWRRKGDRAELEGFPLRVYPAMGAMWDRYIWACSIAGWPPEVDPALDSGMWVITTRSQALVDELDRLFGRPPTRIDPEQGYIYRINWPGYRKHYQIARALRRHHKGHVLPRRTADDDARDFAPVPMAEKSIAFGNPPSGRVEVTDRAVLVPLVPLGPDGEAVAQTIVADLERLVRQDGLPYTKARPWLAEWLQSHALARLDRDLASATA